MMRKPHGSTLRGVCLAVVACCGASTALASGGGIKYRLSGFGTLTATTTDQSAREFRTSMRQSKGASNHLDLGTDSRLGVQGVVDFGSGFTATGQLLAQRRRVDSSATSNRDFDLGVEWLFAQYSPTTNVDLRLGRVVLPAFMISDSRNVGYAQPWLRAPLEVYSQLPMSTLDGAQVNWRIPVGGAIVTIQPTYGSSASNSSSGGTAVETDGKPTLSLNASVEWGDWLARIGRVRSTSEMNLSLGPITLDYDMTDTFTSAGVQYDNGQAIVMAEVAQRRQNDAPAPLRRPLAKSDSWYVGAGWRVGKLLPMLAYGATKDKLTNDKIDSTSLSLRYDVITNVALKAQISRHMARDTRAFVNPAQSANKDYRDRVNVLSFGVDFVF